MYNREYTPERITSLAENEIFVFGSNLAGAHGGGAARLAYMRFGAVWGEGVGFHGQTYAIPTMQGGVDTIKPYVEEFIRFARENPHFTFLVTRIGCGIAGFREEEIAPLFKDAIDIANVILPKEFVASITLNIAKNKKIFQNVIIKDCIRGCLMAGAAGDALGYTVEFMSRDAILAKFGSSGITQFELDRSGKVLVSDDTQMTLFSANGLLMGLTRGYMRGVGGVPEGYVRYAYLDWYYTQGRKDEERRIPCTWLRDLPELAHRRAPGNTCLSACEAMLNFREVKNNSKGCGGIMRVAPMALLAAGYLSREQPFYSVARMDAAGAEIARVTHKHPLGFLPAAMLTHLLYKLVPLTVQTACAEFEQIARETVGSLDEIYRGEFDEDKQYLTRLTLQAIELATNNREDAENIRRLGEGWVAEETWAIALYCALRHKDSVRDALIAAVNHDGDSDSTGAVCGNIMGAIYGYMALKRQNLFCPYGKAFEETLELSNITLALADDLYTGCIIREYAPIDTPEKQQWYERYCEMRPAGLNRPFSY